jgi:hypothetical protein
MKQQQKLTHYIIIVHVYAFCLYILNIFLMGTVEPSLSLVQSLPIRYSI